MFVEKTSSSILQFVKRLSQYKLSLDINDWVRELDSINPYDIHQNITYDLVMVVEDEPSDYKKINMVQFYTQFQREPAILAINSIDVYDMVYYCDVDQPYIPSSFKKIVVLACTEASIYLKGSKVIPNDLFAKLIKIKIIISMWQMIYKRKKELTMSNRDEYYAPVPGEGKGKKGGKGSKKGGKKKEKKKKGGKKKEKGKKGKKGKGKKEKPDVYPCGDILNKPVKDDNAITSITISDDVIPHTHLYVILTGFHEPRIIEYLTMNGFHLSVLVKFKEIPVEGSLENLIRSGSSFFSQQANLSKDVLEKDLFTKKSTILRRFWSTIMDEYGESHPHHLDDSFILNYTPPLLPEEVESSEMYLKQCEIIFFHFLDALKQCQEFRELHKAYLEHLKVYKLGYGSYITVKEMLRYGATINTIPLSISEPPFIIEGLLDQIVVCEKNWCSYPVLEEDEYKKIKQDRGHSSATRWESMYAITPSTTTETLSCEKTGELYHTREEFYANLCNKNQEGNFQCHISFNDQIKRLLDFHRKRVIEYRKERNGDLYQFLPVLDKNPFIIHESNYIDLALTYYKYLPECVKDIWFDSFIKNPHIQFCKNIPKTSDEDETVYKKQLEEWHDLLGLDIDELINSMLLLFYGRVSCSKVKSVDSNSTLVEQHFHTDKINFDSNYVTDIVTMMSSQQSTTTATEPYENHYEKINPSKFKWLEDLSPNVAVQAFHNAQNEYCCVDCKRIEMFNAVLVRFHNDCDEFGLNQKLWDVTLRVPVNFREFMHMIVFKDTQFLLAHESKRRAIKKFYDDIMKYELMVNRFTAEEQDFLFKESLKVLLSNPVEAEPVPAKKKKGKKGKKGKKDKKGKRGAKGKKGGGKKGKKKSGKSATKGKQKKDTNPRDTVEKEPFDPGISYQELAEDTKVKENADKLTLPALDYDKNVLRVVGSTTTFHSLDDFAIVIDKYKITSSPLSVSASITLNGNVIHVHKRFTNDFAFHVNLSSGAIATFGKPPSILERDMRFYLIEELQNKHLHCLGGAVPKRREMIMASKCFHDMINLPDLRHDDYSPQKETSFPGGKTKRASGFSVKSMTSKRGSWMKDAKPAHLVQSASSVIPVKRNDDVINLSGPDSKGSSIKFSFDGEEEGECEIPSFDLQGFVDDIMRFKQSLPAAKFKILSSPLHRFCYIKRKKSNLEIELADVIRYVLSMYKNKLRYIRVKHAYDLNIRKNKKGNRPVEAPTIAFRITLPNGLHIKNVFHVDGTYIVQNYISKGPENTDIVDEGYRIFLRDGSIAIKKSKGDFLVYQANGEVIHYELPLNKTNWSPFFLFKKRDNSKKNVDSLLESTNRRVKRMNKQVLEDYECNHTVSRTCASYRRKQFKCKKALLLKEIKFNLITCDGSLIRYHNGNVRQSDRYNYERMEQIETYQSVFRRSDGTVSIFNKLGVLETTFADATRITSWCESEPELVKIDLTKRLGVNGKIGPFTKVDVFYQFEHPKYASVTYDTTSDDMKFTIPGNIELQASNNSCSVISDHKTLISVDTAKIVMESIPCEDCKKYCVCKVNSKPLFYNKAPEAGDIFFKAKDTFEKLILGYFNGNIRRNSDYIKEEMPCASTSHKRYPPQKVMLIFKDLHAKYLWSEDMYANRMANVLEPENVQLVLYVNDKNLQVETTEIRTYEQYFYNGNFRMPYLPSMVINDDPKSKFDIDRAVYMKQRLLHSISISNINYLFNFVSKDEKLTKSDCARAFRVKSLIETCQPSDVFVERSEEPIKPKMRIRASYENKIKTYKRKLEIVCKEVAVAKDVKNLVPYFKKQQSKKHELAIIQDVDGECVGVELLSERSGKSNRSVAGSIFDTASKSTSMPEGTYDLLDHIDTDEDAHLYERQRSYTVAVKDDPNELLLDNVFSIATIDNLIVTPIKSKTVVVEDAVEDAKRSKTILTKKSDVEITKKAGNKDVKRPESKLRFADGTREKTRDNLSYQPKPRLHFLTTSAISVDSEISYEIPSAPRPSASMEDDDSALPQFEDRLSSKSKTTGCMQDLQDSLKNLILQGAWDDSTCSPHEGAQKGNLSKNNDKKTKKETKPTHSNQISRNIERLFNVVQTTKTEPKLPKTAPRVTVPDECSNISDSIDLDYKTDLEKNHTRSASLQTISSQMMKPSVLEQFSHFEILTLLEEAGVTPLMYHEISELDLVRQLMGLAGSGLNKKKAEKPQQLDLPQYEAMTCDQQVRGYEDDIPGSEEEKLKSSTSSSSSNNPDECKDIVGGEEEAVEEEIEEEELSSVHSNGSIKSIHKSHHPSHASIRASVFDFPIIGQDEKAISRDGSMIPLINEKSLLRTIRKDFKKVYADQSSSQITPRKQKMTIDISTSSSTSSNLEPFSSSSEDRTESTSNASVSSAMIDAKDKLSIESPTPQASTSTIKISPSLRVFRDRLSYDSKVYNVMVESVGISTVVKKEAETGTDLPYGDDDA